MPSPLTSTNTANNARNHKLMPAILLKQLRATASLHCYDYLFLENSMKKVDLWRRGYHLFHGNEDLNIISQVNLVVRGHGYYTHIYDRDVNVVTDHDRNNASIDDDITGDPSNSTHRLVVKELFNLNNNTFRFTSGVHFTIDTVALSSKSSMEQCVGRAIIKLGKAVLQNIKKKQ